MPETDEFNGELKPGTHTVGSQKRMVLSFEPDAMSPFWAEKATEYTAPCVGAQVIIYLRLHSAKLNSGLEIARCAMYHRCAPCDLKI